MEKVEIDQRKDGADTLKLSRTGEIYQVHNGEKLVYSSDWRGSENSLIELALAPLRDRDDTAVLLTGLHMGFTARSLLDAQGVVRVDVIEPVHSWIDWEAQYFAAANGDIRKDSRLHVHPQTLADFIRNRPEHVVQGLATGWFAIVIDTDASHPAVQPQINDEGLAELENLLRPGGVLAFWSTVRDLELTERLRRRFQNVAEVVTPVDLGSDSELRYVYRARRMAPASHSAN